MKTVVKNLGPVTAYKYAVNGGYQGTEEEFESELANIADVSAQANTLAPGSAATANYENGVITIGVPRGADGANGRDGRDGVQIDDTAGSGDTDKAWSADKISEEISNVRSAIGSTVTVSGTTPSITAVAENRYICGEVAELTITVPASGCIDVVFTSGSTPTVLTVTPPTGVTIQWANDFDPTSLSANTTYELNILNGSLGVAVEWA